VSALAALCCAAAVALAFPFPPVRRLSGPSAAAPQSNRIAESGTLRVLASVAVGLAVGVFLGGWFGAVATVVVAVGSFRVLRHLGDRGRDEGEEQLAAQAADVADMIGACVASGAGLERATVQVAQAVSAPASEVLARAAGQLALGANANRAWSELLQHDATAPIARAIVRSLDSGAPMADALTWCAGELRDIRRARVEAMAQAVAVKAVGPLGLCFLPAFLLIGVVPIVAGLVTESIDLF